MSFIKCPECGKKLSSFAAACPNCGCLVENFDKVIEEQKSIKAAAKTLFENVQVGDQVSFGSYAGKPMEWRVLEIRPEKLCAISVNCLDIGPFNYNRSKGNEFETSDLKEWLDNTFLSKTFSAEEQRLISKITCLSVKEAYRYFSDDDDRVVYPLIDGEDGSVITRGGACHWWLRSAGYRSDLAAYVYTDGHIDSNGTYVDLPGNAARPVIWVSL